MPDQEPKMTSESSRPDTAKEPTSAPTGQASMSTASYAEGSDSGVGRSYVGAFGSVALLLVLLAAMTLAVYCLVVVWPSPSGSTASISSLFGMRLSPNRDQQLFLVVGLSGAVGGFIHSPRS